MSQNTSVESSTRSQFKPSINPALQAVLGSLDVQLEEELARYRRQRAGRPALSVRGIGRSQTRKPVELISVARVGEPTQPPVSVMTNASGSNSLAPATLIQKAETELAHKTPNASIKQTGQQESLSPVASDSAKALVAPSPTLGTVDKTSVEVTTPPTLNPSEKPQDEGDLLASQQTPPEDYLESSEKLLRSLAEPEVAVGSPKKRFTNKILTPLGIGSILLLLLSSATLTYIFTNPSSRSSLGLDRFFGSKSATTAKNQSANSSTTGNSNQNSPINGPNLASDEFTDVSLDTLTQLEASPSPSPVPSPVTALPNSPNYEATAPAPASVVPPPVLPESYVDLPRAILQPPLQPGAVPPEAAPKPIPSANNPSSKAAQKKPPATPAKTTPLKQSAASPAQTPAASSTSNAKSGEFYYVVTNYNGDRSLEQARTIVPDAYIRNLPQGTKIQLGAFKLQSEADTLIEQLRQQGISASVYSP